MTKQMIKPGREAKIVPVVLRGSHATVEGTVTRIRCRSNNREHKIYMLSPVYIAGKVYDHVWIRGCKLTKDLKLGDKVSFFAKMSTYEHKSQKKWCVKLPYNSFNVGS